MISMFDRSLERATGLVHCVTVRLFPINLGDGNIDYEDMDVTFCDIPLQGPSAWREQLDNHVFVTCLPCLAEALAVHSTRYRYLGTATGRMTASPNAVLSSTASRTST